MVAIDASWFETTIGRCSVSWSELGVTSIRLLADFGHTHAAPSPLAAAAIMAIVHSLAGEDGAEARLQAVVLDIEDVPPFARSVYAEARRIPRGHTRTYGDLARALGKPGGSRAVGQALGRNPFPLVVPCHRVVALGGAAGGFTAPGGLATKAQLLAIEGLRVGWPS